MLQGPQKDLYFDKQKFNMRNIRMIILEDKMPHSNLNAGPKYRTTCITSFKLSGPTILEDDRMKLRRIRKSSDDICLWYLTSDNHIIIAIKDYFRTNWDCILAAVSLWNKMNMIQTAIEKHLQGLYIEKHLMEALSWLMERAKAG